MVVSLGHMTTNLVINDLTKKDIVHPQGGADPLERAIDAFCAALIGRNRAELTIKAYRADLFAFVDWLRGVGSDEEVGQNPG